MLASASSVTGVEVPDGRIVVPLANASESILALSGGWFGVCLSEDAEAVSYTHLTLLTILLV